MRCRIAHNHDTSQRRGLTDQQRYAFLTWLRSGKTVEEAAEAAGVTAGALSQAARRDGELRAALDGMPVGVQVAARRAEFMAALVRCGGNQTLAEAQAGLPGGTVGNWRQSDPGFDAVVQAVRGWLGAATTRQLRKRYTTLSPKDLDRLREMWVNGATGQEIADELNVDRGTVSRWRKRLDLPARQRPDLFGTLSGRFRELWASGASYSQIRSELKIADPTISEWRKALDLPARKP